jgi:hypothetical protein
MSGIFHVRELLEIANRKQSDDKEKGRVEQEGRSTPPKLSGEITCHRCQALVQLEKPDMSV